MEVWQIILIVLGAVIGFVLSLAILYVIVVAIAAACVNPNRNYDKVSGFYRALLMIGGWACMTIGRIKIKVNGENKLPDGEFLLVQNHRSNFDPIVTTYALHKRKIAFISKVENFSIPLFGRIIRKMCFMPIDRENPREAMKTILRGADLMKRGAASVAVYPEGTRNKSAEGLLPFHNGVFKMAQRASVPVVVTTVTGTENIHKNFFRRRSIINIDIAEVIPADRVKAEGSGEIGDYARSVIARNLGVNPEAPADNSTTPEPTFDRTR